MDDYDDYCDLIDDDEEKIEMFKDIKQDYEFWLDCYEDAHDEEFFPFGADLCPACAAGAQWSGDDRDLEWWIRCHW